MIKYFKNAHSRWCCIFKNFPQAYMLEQEIGMMHQANDDSDSDAPLKAPAKGKEAVVDQPKEHQPERKTKRKPQG